MSYLGVQSWELVLHSALHKILALHLLKTYFTLKDTYTDGISTALREKTNSLSSLAEFQPPGEKTNSLERKLTLVHSSKSKRKRSSFIAAGCAPQMLLSLKVESPYLLFCGYIVMSFHQLESKTWILNSCARFTLHISDYSKCAIQKHCELETFYIWGKIEWWLVKVELVAAGQQISPICLMTFDTSPEARVGVHSFVANHCCASFAPSAF